jgi:hypothetical protein
MITYILRKMLKHLAVLIFVNIVFFFLIRIPKSSHVGYDMKLVKQPKRDIISATLISISFSAISLFLINLIQWNKDILIVISGFFISLGAGRQIFATAMDAVTTNMNSFLSSWASILHLLAKDRMATTPEWGSIEIQIELLLFGRGLQYELPAKLDRAKSDSPQVSKYLDEHKWELEYKHPITGEDPSYLAFAHHATKQMRDKLRIYDELLGVQQKSGGANTVVLIAIGTLFWLLS